MGLKKAISPKTQDKYLELMKKVSDLQAEVYQKQLEIEKCQIEMAEIRLAPFKVGQDVMCEVSSGRTRKVQKCKIEIENGSVYVRPYKNDGELSNRHFNFTPVGDKTYADYFKEVK